MKKKGEGGARGIVSLDSLIFRVFDIRKQYGRSTGIGTRTGTEEIPTFSGTGTGTGTGFFPLEGMEIWTGYGLI